MELESSRILKKRKPLSDCTNIVSRNPHISPIKKNPNLASGKSLLTKPPKPHLFTTDQKSSKNDTGIGSNYVENPRILRTQPPSIPPPRPTPNSSVKAENPRIRTQRSTPPPRPRQDSSVEAENPRICTHPSTPLRQILKSSADSVVIECENAGVSTVYSRRRPVEKTRDNGKEVMVSVPFSCPPPRRTGSIGDKRVKEERDFALSNTYKKRRFSLPVKSTLPRDFIDKQKAYFAEIDAFELPEEVVSESELE